VSAMCLGLAGSEKVLDRQKKLTQFILRGETKATIEIELCVSSPRFLHTFGVSRFPESLNALCSSRSAYLDVMRILLLFGCICCSSFPGPPFSLLRSKSPHFSATHPTLVRVSSTCVLLPTLPSGARTCQRSQLGGGSVEVKRIIENNGSPNGSTSWFIDSVRKTEKEVKALARSLNIQISNLCQFVPQERVSAFAEMSPQQLLQASGLLPCSTACLVRLFLAGVCSRHNDRTAGLLYEVPPPRCGRHEVRSVEPRVEALFCT
jgi:hypothetical protein